MSIHILPHLKGSLVVLDKMRALVGKTNIYSEINSRTSVMQEQWGAGSGSVVSKPGATQQIAANSQISA